MNGKLYIGPMWLHTGRILMAKEGDREAYIARVDGDHVFGDGTRSSIRARLRDWITGSEIGDVSLDELEATYVTPGRPGPILHLPSRWFPRSTE